MLRENSMNCQLATTPLIISETNQSAYPCVMNSKLIFNKDESYLSFTCNSCPGKSDNICYLCMENCHKNHITNRKNLKERRVNLKTTQCSCALRDHKVSKPRAILEEYKTDNNEIHCNLSEIIYTSNVMHFYIDPVSHNYYCLYCLDACQGVLHDALENYIKKDKSKLSEGAATCSCSNKDAHSSFQENILSLTNFILSPVFDKILNRVQLPGQILSSSSLCEKYLYPIKIAHNTILKDFQKKIFNKYKTEASFKSYLNYIKLLQSLAQVLKKDTNFMTDKNIQAVYSIDFLLEIFSTHFYDDYSIIETKINTLYFFRKFFLLPIVNYKKWHDGYTDFDNITPFHRLTCRKNIKEFFELSKLNKKVFMKLLDKIHICIVKYFDKIEELQYTQLVIEYLKWIILVISYKFDTHDKESQMMYHYIISKFLQIVDLVTLRKSFETSLKKYFEIFIVKIMLLTNDEILFSKILNKSRFSNSKYEQFCEEICCYPNEDSQNPLNNLKEESNIEEYNPEKSVSLTKNNYQELLEEEEIGKNEINSNNNDDEIIIKGEESEQSPADLNNKYFKDSQHKFIFESGEFQISLIKALFAFGKDEKDVSKHISTGEIYDMLVNDNDYYYEVITNYANSKNSKENLEILIQSSNGSIQLSQDEEKDINLIKGSLEFLYNLKQKFYAATINVKEILESTANIFHVTLKYLAGHVLTAYVCSEDENSENELEKIRKNNFKIQIYLFKTGLFDTLLDMWYVLTSNKYIANSVDEIDPSRLNLGLAEILKNFLFLCHENSFLSALLFNNQILSIIFEYKYEEERDFLVKSFFADILKILSKTKHKLNLLNFLDTILTTNFVLEKLEEVNVNFSKNKKRQSYLFEEKKIIAQLSILQKVLKNSTLKTLPKINHSIGVFITKILSSNYYMNKLEYFKKNMDDPNEFTKKFLIGVHKIINNLADSYFIIITDYLNINDIEFLLSHDTLDPRARRIFTITYSKFYSECPFKIFESLNKKGMKNFRNKIDYNLIGKFVILDGEFETENNKFNSPKNQLKTENNFTSENQTESFNPDAIFLPLLQNMEKYKRIIKNYSEDYFQRKIRFFVKYFTDVILFPSIFSIYKILYFSARTSAKYKYLIYRFIYLFMLCYKHFLTCITKNTDLNLAGSLKRADNLTFLSNCFNHDKQSSVPDIKYIIDFMLTTIEELNVDINLFQTQNFDPLKLEIVMENWGKYLWKFKAANNVLNLPGKVDLASLEKTSEGNQKKVARIKKSSAHVCMHDQVRSFLADYRERKMNLDNNILFSLYQEQTGESSCKDNLKKTIALDLLFRLEGRDLSDIADGFASNTNPNSKRDLPTATTGENLRSNINRETKRIDSVDYVNQYGTALIHNESIEEDVIEENHFISIYHEGNSEILDTINKLFKANPDLWQAIITDSCPTLKKKIFDIIRKELTYVIQFIFVKFHKLSRFSAVDSHEYKTTIYNFEKAYILRIIEFFRLFCENHHKIFQTFLTNNYIIHNELNLIDFILQIPVAVLTHSEYFKGKKTRGILKYFREEESDNLEYFNDLLESTNNFLVELIQGAFADNYDFIASRKEFKIYYEFGYRFFDSIDAGEDGERFSANFMKFINCYLEENTNSVENKVAIMNKFKPSKLLNVLLFSFKKLCYIYLVENKKKFFKENSQEINVIQQSFNSYNVPISASKDLLEIFKQTDSIRNHHLFVLASNIFIFFKSSTYFKSGEKIKSLLANLQKLSQIHPKKIPEKNKHATITKREVYNFFNAIIKEVEVSYKFSNEIDDIELIKYRDYFDEDFFEFDKLKKYIKEETNGIQNVIYVVHPDSLLIEPSDLVKFNETAPFENFNIKLNYILEYYQTLSAFIKLRKFLANKNSKILNFFFYLDYHKASLVSILITIIINSLIVLTSLVVDRKQTVYRNSNDSGEFYGVLPYNKINEGKDSGNFSRVIEAYGLTVVNYVSTLHLICLFVLILNWINFSIYKLNNLGNKSKLFLFKLKRYTALLFEKEIFPLVWIFMFLLLALLNNNNKFAYSLQLLAIFQKVPTMQTVIYSVTIRYKQFLSATFLIMILMLFYSSISFYLFRDEYYNPDIDENVCGTFLSCFLSLITNGIRGGAGLGFSMKSIKDSHYFNSFIFEWIFYFSIMLIMLNVINGIIVDTFQALREHDNLKEDIRVNVCYICSLNRSKFDIRGVSFDHHVNVEHNALNYFYYILKVQLSEEQELNSLDYQVLNNIKERRTDFFPIKKALSLA